MKTTNERFIPCSTPPPAADEFRLLCKKIAEMDALRRAGLQKAHVEPALGLSLPSSKGMRSRVGPDPAGAVGCSDWALDDSHRTATAIEPACVGGIA